jgi:hypothetical protein
MSRGLGRIERAIEALFTAEPSRTFSTDELVEVVYRGVNRIEKKHRVAVLRAADKVAKRSHWEKWKCERTFQGGYYEASLAGRGAVYVNMLDARSYGLGMLRICYDNARESRSTAELEAMLDDKDFAPGGSWWFAVEEAKIKFGIAVDRETQRLIAARKKSSEEGRQEWVAAFAGGLPPKERERRARRSEANAHGRICAKCGKAIEPNAPMVRMPVSRRGWMGVGVTIEVQCFDCGERALADRFFVVATRCMTCGREVHQAYRRNRRRTFCCDDCRRPGKRGGERHVESAAASLPDAPPPAMVAAEDLPPI